MKSYLTKHSEHVYISPPDGERDRPVMGIVVGSKRTLIVEAGASPAHVLTFKEAMTDLKLPDASFVALTHWHWDHVFGIATFDLPTFGHRKTRQFVREMADLDWQDEALNARVEAGEEIPSIREYVIVELSNEQRAELVITAPDLIYDDQVDVDLGEVTCQLIHVGGDHSVDSCVIFIPEDKTVFLGDSIYSGFIGEDLFFTPEKVFPLIDRLLDLKAKFYLPAHSKEVMSREDLEKMKAEMKHILACLQKHHWERQITIQELEISLKQSLDEDQIYYLDAFIRGQKEDILS
ncbi:MAG: MBL fold metallo-hydrolase [Anaerolineaceae bacterium]|nr:MBL fold metallo-hydrolase [Anaerolineaceae bacterium]